MTGFRDRYGYELTTGSPEAAVRYVEDTLLEAALRAERFETAAEILRERLSRRPSKRDRAAETRVAVGLARS